MSRYSPRLFLLAVKGVPFHTLGFPAISVVAGGLLCSDWDPQFGQNSTVWLISYIF